MKVVLSKEEARGCGFRKPSAGGVGIYLMGEGAIDPCGKLPLPLNVCPACSAGIKPSRGWTWIDPTQLFAHAPDCGLDDPLARRRRRGASVRCAICPVGTPPEGRHGLLWIGEKFYRPDEFMAEAKRLGISRKVSAIPKGFELGKTWVYLAHRHAVSHVVPGEEPRLEAGVFSVFKPSRVDLVVEDARNVPEKAQRLADSLGDAARIVVVEPIGTAPLNFEEEEEPE